MFILGYLNNQQVIFEKYVKNTMFNFGIILRDINFQIEFIIGNLNDILEENLKNIRKNILMEFEKIWIPEKQINSNLKLSLESKNLDLVIPIPSTLIIFPFAPAYGVIWKLTSSFLKSEIPYGQRETKFYDYIKNMQEEINSMMKDYLVYYIVEIKKFENLINEVIQIFIGLIEASYIHEDDNYSEAKNNYLKIFEAYKAINNIK